MARAGVGPLSRTPGAAIALPSDRAAAWTAILVAAGASLPTTSIGSGHRVSSTGKPRSCLPQAQRTQMGEDLKPRLDQCANRAGARWHRFAIDQQAFAVRLEVRAGMIGDIVEQLLSEDAAHGGLVDSVDLVLLGEFLMAVEANEAVAKRRPGPALPTLQPQDNIGQIQFGRAQADGRLMPALRMFVRIPGVLILEDADLHAPGLAVHHVAEPARASMLKQIKLRKIAPVAVDPVEMELQPHFLSHRLERLGAP